MWAPWKSWAAYRGCTVNINTGIQSINTERASSRNFVSCSIDNIKKVLIDTDSMGLRGGVGTLYCSFYLSLSLPHLGWWCVGSFLGT